LFSHLVVDRHAMIVLGRDFTEMLVDPSTRAPGPPRHQPLDQVAQEGGTVAPPAVLDEGSER
jgi:hypothetical protein